MSDTPPKEDNTFPGLIAMAAGLVVAYFVHSGSQPGDAPTWIGDACAAAFICAGLAIVAAPRGWGLLSKLAGLGAAYLIVVPAIWVVIGGDPARCSISAALGSFDFADAGAGLCRGVFGLGTLLSLLVAIALTWSAFRRRAPERPAPPRN